MKNEFTIRRDVDGNPTNVPAVGLADNSPPEELHIHGSLGFAYTYDRSVLSMFVGTAEKVDGVWRSVCRSRAAA